MTNILEAIYNIIDFGNFEIKDLYQGRNRANSIGEALENYIKDAFVGTLKVKSEKKRMKIFDQEFSWLGSQNHPPDIMIKGGDAIEVKKTQNANNKIALNSSYPKASLYSSSPMITEDCKECEDWERKELIYSIGHTSDERLHSLWLVYGSIYAAKDEIYQRIKKTISTGIETIPDVEFAETKELGRVNRVDLLGITSLRIRGMWQIQNPRKAFDYLYESTKKNEFELICIIPNDKYNSFPERSISKLEGIKMNGFSIENVQVKNPNNPAKLIDCKFVKYILQNKNP